MKIHEIQSQILENLSALSILKKDEFTHKVGDSIERRAGIDSRRSAISNMITQRLCRMTGILDFDSEAYQNNFMILQMGSEVGKLPNIESITIEIDKVLNKGIDLPRASQSTIATR